jgi:putative heme-binding domain-containing protein
MTLAQLDSWPVPWVVALRKELASRDDTVARQAVATVRASDQLAFAAPLMALGKDRSRGRDLRVEALDAAAPWMGVVEPPVFDFLVSQLDRAEVPLCRLAAARALGRAPLNSGQLLALTRVIGAVGALSLPQLLPAFTRSHDPGVGSALVAALDRSPGLRSLTPEVLEQSLRSYPAEVRHNVEPLIRKLEFPEAEKALRLAGVANLIGLGDVFRGRAVFFGTRAACSTCHTIRGEGGRVGPDLSRIGAARTGRDLFESILFPSASFARGYEPYVIARDDGHVLTGVILNQTADSIVLATQGRLEVPIARRSIEAIEPGRVSLMPRGLDANLTEGDLADLVAFLQSLR